MCNGITIGGDVSIQISGPSVPPDGSITAAKIGSGNAGDGQVLTADGAGGAAWEAAGGSFVIPFIGTVGDGENSPTTAEITAAFLATVGRLPANGEFCRFTDGCGNHMPETLIYYYSGTSTWYVCTMGTV